MGHNPLGGIKEYEITNGQLIIRRRFGKAPTTIDLRDATPEPAQGFLQGLTNIGTVTIKRTGVSQECPNIPDIRAFMAMIEKEKAILRGEMLRESDPELSYRFRSRSGEPFPLSQREQASERLCLLLHDYLDAKASGERDWKNDFSDTLEELRSIFADYSAPPPIANVEKTQYKIRHLFNRYDTASDPMDRAQWAREIEKERQTPVEKRVDDRGDNPDLNYPDWIPKAANHVLSPVLKAWGGIDYAYSSYLVAREAVAEELARTHTESGIRNLIEIVEEKVELLDNTARGYLAGELDDKPPQFSESRSDASSPVSVDEARVIKRGDRSVPVDERQDEQEDAHYSEAQSSALERFELEVPFSMNDLDRKCRFWVTRLPPSMHQQVHLDYEALRPLAS